MSSHIATDVIEVADAREAYSIATSSYGAYDGQCGNPRMEGSQVISALATKNTAHRYIPQTNGSADGDFIVPLTNDFETVTRTVTINIDGDEYLRTSQYSPLATAHAAGLNRVVDAAFVKEPRLPKPTVTVTEGEMIRVYDVHHRGFAVRDMMGYASLALARAAATKLVADGKALRASVKGRIVRDDDELLVVTQTAPETVKVTLEVTEEVPRKGASVDAHYVLFWVHS